MRPTLRARIDHAIKTFSEDVGRHAGELPGMWVYWPYRQMQRDLGRDGAKRVLGLLVDHIAKAVEVDEGR